MLVGRVSASANTSATWPHTHTHSRRFMSQSFSTGDDTQNTPAVRNLSLLERKRGQREDTIRVAWTINL